MTTKFDKEIWAEGEHYLYGEVTDWCGAQQPNIHFKTDDNKSYIIACKKEDIKEDSVYQQRAVMVIANQNIETGNLKALRLVSFVEYAPAYNEKEWQITQEKSRKVWADVPNHVAWVRNLRSDDEQTFN